MENKRVEQHCVWPFPISPVICSNGEQHHQQQQPFFFTSTLSLTHPCACLSLSVSLSLSLYIYIYIYVQCFTFQTHTCLSLEITQFSYNRIFLSIHHPPNYQLSLSLTTTQCFFLPREKYKQTVSVNQTPDSSLTKCQHMLFSSEFQVLF